MQHQHSSHLIDKDVQEKNQERSSHLIDIKVDQNSLHLINSDILYLTSSNPIDNEIEEKNQQSKSHPIDDDVQNHQILRRKSLQPQFQI